ncbi:SOG2 Leucine-rich repeat-containing protein SOG2 [Candida maltosa Xu316]
MSSRSHIIGLLKDQIEVISQKKTIKLNSLNTNLKPFDVVEIIYDFDPPLELEKLFLQNNQFTELPSNCHKIASHLKYLDLHQNLISYIPHDFFYKFDALEILYLASNRLSTLPESLSSISSLKVLSIKDNNFKYLPPQIGDMHNLNLIEVAGNPLILPSNDIIRAFQKQKPDLDWVGELKHYLVANRALLYSKIEESMEDSLSHHSASTTTPPSIKRSQTTGDVPTRTKSASISTTSSSSSKASRRMGLIIKKPEDGHSNLLTKEENDDDVTQHHFESVPENISFQIQNSPTHPTTATTTMSTAVSNKSAGSSKQTSSRSRSNTLREIDRMLEKNDSVDTEHKSNAYFKRLSTLQETPTDEQQNESSEQPRLTLDPKQIQSTRSNIPTPNEGSPTRPQHPAKTYSNPIIVKVSRKILFSFSELHSSIRRFTAFCTDKKVTMKMVSYLYSTKTNIDTLVENLEIMEEAGSNTEQIVNALHSCVGSFKSIMKLLHENINSFVGNIEVCFIRMVYLSVYGSINELQNAYLLLVSRPTNPKTPSDFKQKLSINTAVDSFDEVDEKLYNTIESATSSTQVIFAELNKAVNKGASTANGGVIHPNVASKIKELTNVCGSSLDIIKRLNTKLITIRNNPSVTTKKLFAEDINQFIKTMVQTLASVKAIVKDIPILDDIRASMSNLTKTAKEVTYLFELSSYKLLLPDPSSSSASNSNPQQPQLVSIPSVSNLFTPVAAHAPSLPISGPASMRNPMAATTANTTTSTSTLSSPPSSQDNPAVSAQVNGPFTAPQSLGQMYAKNGANPFDGLIMAKNNENHRINE